MFTIETFLNQYLPTGSSRVDAVFSIAADKNALPVTVKKTKKVIGFIGDVSGSMGGNKIEEMKSAIRLAIDLIPEDMQFYVIAFSDRAKLVVPLSYATSANKRSAHDAVKRMEAFGGTEMSKALLLARDTVRGLDGVVNQVYFLTDGQNGDGNIRLEQAVASCEGLFQVHCRGVGTDWVPDQLRVIANSLLGTVDLVAKPANLAADIKGVLDLAISKTVSNVRLRLWQPAASKIKMFKQGFPTEIDLTNKLTSVDARNSEFALGSWGDGTQDYCATFEVTPREPGEEMLVCRPSLIFTDPDGKEVVIPATNVTVKWSENPSLTARINEQVAHYTGQAEKAKAIQEGLEALGSGNVDVATHKLGRALKLAAEAGDEGTVRRLKQVVDVVDEATGTVKVKRNTSKEELMNLDVASTRTVRAARVAK